MSDIFDKMNLDFLGAVSLFGGEIALAAISCCFLEKYRIFLSGYLSPGTLTVANHLLKRSNYNLAKALTTGTRDKCGDVIVELLDTGKFSYVGLLSGTRAEVINPFGAAVLNIRANMNKVSDTPQNGKPEKPPTYVDFIHASWNPITDGSIEPPKNLNPLGLISPIITLGAFGYVLWLKDITGALIIIIGAIINMLLTYVTYNSKYSFKSAKAADGSPPGNAVVKSDLTPYQLWVVTGDENAVRRLLQGQIIVEEPSQYQSLVNLITGLLVYAYNIFIILALSLSTTFVQIMIGILFVIGTLTNIMYASNNDNLLYSFAKKDMNLNENKKGHAFKNRTASIAYCVLRCESKSEHIGDLLPKGLIWGIWRKVIDDIMEIEEGIDLKEKRKATVKEWREKIKDDPEIIKYYKSKINDALKLWNFLLDSVDDAIEVFHDQEKDKKGAELQEEVEILEHLSQ